MTMKKEITIAALVGLSFGVLAGLVHGKDTFEAKETDLRAFEYHDEVVLTATKPLYRLGEILQLQDGRYVVPINYYWAGHEWKYLVAQVKVAERSAK